MIALLEGRLISQDEQKIILLAASGVGYQIYYQGQLKKESQVRVFIAHVIKEASQELYGFKSFEEKELFELLITVNKVGPKSAYALMVTLGRELLIEAVTSENVDILKKAKGVGLAQAKQIILSLKSKVDKLNIESKDSSTGQVFDIEENAGWMNEALSALGELGFKESEVIPLIREKMSQVNSVEELITSVLRRTH